VEEAIVYDNEGEVEEGEEQAVWTIQTAIIFGHKKGWPPKWSPDFLE
jgi:hypothetical protein